MKKPTDLKEINNLKVIFRNMRDYIAGNMTGITRDEEIARNIILVLFCKLYDEKYNKKLLFYTKAGETNEDLKNRIDDLLVKVKKNYDEIFDARDEITINGDVLRHVIEELETYKLLDTSRDIIADAFEELIGTSFRGGEGQFFTPRNIVEMIISVLNPQPGEWIMEPACGSGGFLAYILKNIQTKTKANYHLHGIEKDGFLSKVARMYLAVLGDPDYNVFCENSLDIPDKWNRTTQKVIDLNKYDVILTNPPFGAKIPITDPEILSQYELGHVWKKNKGEWILTDNIRDKQPPQILFFERIVQLLKPGGRAGIVLPDGMFGNPSDRYIWEYAHKYVDIIGVISLSQEAFQPSTHTKTSVIFIRKKDKKKSKLSGIFMATAKNIGHNKNGKEIFKMKLDGTYVLDEDGNRIIDDDIPEITNNFCKYLCKSLKNENEKGFIVPYEKIIDYIYIPEHYYNKADELIKKLSSDKKHQFVTIKELLDKNVISIKRGNEIGSQYYGTGDVPFVRTSDIVNWEIKADPVKAISEEAYNLYKDKQKLKVNDILFVNDGTFLIGRSAMVTEEDLKIVIQSHLRRIRVEDTNFIDPYYLFYLLNTEVVQLQVKSKVFTQATISTLGDRMNDLMLPMLTDEKRKKKIIEKMKQIFEEKTKNKRRMVEVFNIQ